MGIQVPIIYKLKSCKKCWPSLTSIYLVGFPSAADYPDIEDQTVPVADMIRRLVQEARIVAPHSFRESEDGDEIVEEQQCQAFVASPATRHSSNFRVEEEALSLLKTIQKEISIRMTANRSKVLLAGYSLGGLVVEQVLEIPLNKLDC